MSISRFGVCREDVLRQYLHSTFFSSLTACFLPSCPFGINFSLKTEYPFKNRAFPLISSHCYKELWHSGFLNLSVLYFLCLETGLLIILNFFSALLRARMKIHYASRTGRFDMNSLDLKLAIFHCFSHSWTEIFLMRLQKKNLGHSTIFCHSAAC